MAHKKGDQKSSKFCPHGFGMNPKLLENSLLFSTFGEQTYSKKSLCDYIHMYYVTFVFNLTWANLEKPWFFVSFFRKMNFSGYLSFHKFSSFWIFFIPEYYDLFAKLWTLSNGKLSALLMNTFVFCQTLVFRAYTIHINSAICGRWGKQNTSKCEVRYLSEKNCVFALCGLNETLQWNFGFIYSRHQ